MSRIDRQDLPIELFGLRQLACLVQAYCTVQYFRHARHPSLHGENLARLPEKLSYLARLFIGMLPYGTCRRVEIGSMCQPSATACFNSKAIRSNNSDQSPRRRWRINRMLGYQALVSPDLRRAILPRPVRKPNAGPQGAGQVHDRRIGGNDQVQVHHDRGGVGKRPRLTVHLFAEVDDLETIRDGRQLLAGFGLLQRNEADAGNLGQGPEFGQRDRPQVVPRVATVSLPAYADLEPVDRGQPLAPSLDQVGVGAQVSRGAGIVSAVVRNR